MTESNKISKGFVRFCIPFSELQASRGPRKIYDALAKAGLTLGPYDPALDAGGAPGLHAIITVCLLGKWRIWREDGGKILVVEQEVDDLSQSPSGLFHVKHGVQ